MKVEYIIVHHTGAEEKDAEQVRRYHLSLGWRNVGYNYIIEREGRVVAGRSLNIPGAHCREAGMNFKSAGVAVIGNLMEHPPTPEQWRALIELVRELCRRYGVPPERVLGHKEVPGAATDCPGRFMDMERVRAEVGAAPAGAAGTAAPGGPGNPAAGEGARAVGAAVTGEHRDAGPGPDGTATMGDTAEAAGGEYRTSVNSGPSGLWRVQVGAFAKKENAEALAKKLRSKGYDVYIVKPSG